MNEREKIINQYFNSWLNKDNTSLEKYFSVDVIYSESYGPEYNGIHQVKKWFTYWNKRGSVLEWKTKQFIHENQLTVVEWYFRCIYDGNIYEFDGISLIKFNANNQITYLKEFNSKAEHYYPYS